MPKKSKETENLSSSDNEEDLSEENQDSNKEESSIEEVLPQKWSPS